MKRMGIRELKAHMSETIRAVQGGETIELTHRGEAVALLMPLPRKDDQAERRAVLARLDALTKEIAEQTAASVDVMQILDDVRRY